MSARANRAKQEEAFTLSMVDLFGCGFIAAIFLFILNIIQPQIEAAESKSSASIAGSGQQGVGTTGPVFISVKSRLPLHFMEWPVRDGAPDGSVLGIAKKDDRFKFTYDQVAPDAAGLKWPLRFSLCGNTVLNNADCSNQADPVATSDIVVRVTLGNSTAAAYFVSQRVGDPVSISFAYARDFVMKVNRSYEHEVHLDLAPAKRGNASYRSAGAFYSGGPFTAAMGWSGGEEPRTLSNKKEQSYVISAANCWVFVQSDGSGSDLLKCPDDTRELTESVGEEPWRSDIFAQVTGGCTFPFDHGLCQVAPKAPVAPAQAPNIDGCRFFICGYFRLGIDRFEVRR